MISGRSFWSCGVGILYAVIAAYGQSAPQTIVLPPVGLAATETTEINIISSAASYPGWSFVTTCQALVTFYGADGAAVGVPISFTLGSTGRIFSAALPYASVGAKVSPTAVSAQIALTRAPFVASALSPLIPPCAVAFSLETYDTTTGVAHVLLGGQAGQGATDVAILGAVSVLPCLEGSLTACESIYAYEITPTQVIVVPPVGLAATETARIDITSSVPGYVGSSAASCDASVTFYGADGAAVGVPISFTLGRGGQIFSAALPYASVGGNASPTAVSAQIALTAIPITVFYPASAISPCVAAFSFMTYDTTTGLTHAYITGQSIPDASSAAAVGTAPVHRPPLRGRDGMPKQ